MPSRLRGGLLFSEVRFGFDYLPVTQVCVEKWLLSGMRHAFCSFPIPGMKGVTGRYIS